MPDLYLIAHKVRGEPAFDIATRVEIAGEDAWIISTSGHRAYPWWHWDMQATELSGGTGANLLQMAGDMPPDLPDHYTVTKAPTEPSVSAGSLLLALGLRKPINRRI